MQILPTSTASTKKTFWEAASSHIKDDEKSMDFVSALNKALQGTEKMVEEAESLPSQFTGLKTTVSVKAAVQVQSPYSRNTNNGVTYTLDEVSFTKQELQGLYKDLIKAGANPEVLNKLSTLADMPDGATLGQIMGSLKGGSGTPLLSDEDKENITSLLKKVDPSGVLDTNVQALMMQGKGQEAFGMILNFTAKLDQSASLEIGQEEAVSLGRGLGLGTSTLQTLAQSFGGNTSLTCATGQFADVMAPVANYFTAQAASQKTLDAALKTTLQPLISTARTRTEKEKQANSLHNRKAQQSKVFINKTVQKNSREILDKTLEAGQQAETKNSQVGQQTVAADSRTEATPKQAAEAKTTPQTTQNAAQHAAAQPVTLAQTSADNVASAQPATQQNKNTAAQTQTHAQSATQQATALDDKNQKNTQSGNSQDNKKDSTWSDLLSKVDAQAAAASGRAVTNVGYTATQQAVQNADMQDAVQETAISRQVAQQVEKGLLTSLKGGGTRLDLQLNPQELGSITVSLTVRNGEVSAHIRSEKTETNDMINRQVDAIRTNLEQQGLKVDKVEVQLDSHQEQNTAWQDLNQHNSWQEEDARREELARLKNLSSIRNSSQNSDISALEQPVHSSGQSARYATSTLNVVA